MTDLALRAGEFDATLRLHGVVAGPSRAEAFLAALGATPNLDAAGVYWTARIALLPGIVDLPRFDEAFAAYWGAPSLPLENESTPFPSFRVDDIRPACREEIDDDTQTIALASSDERLRDRDFAELTAAEHAAAARLFARLRVAGEPRRTRRRRPGPHGERIDLRATLHASRRTAYEPIVPRYTHRRETLRPLVFLCDVSGSMEAYARAMLHYAHVSARARPRVRAFTFATHVREVTPILRLRHADAVIAALGRTLHEWGGGTRIGASLREFNDRYAQRGATRGGTVAILSDGWERESPELVASEMARLRRLARRIVWINPRKKDPAFEPLARGMAAALPYLDAFVSGHDLRSLDAVAAAIEGATP